MQLYAEPSAIQYIRNNFDLQNVVIVSPDAGGAKRCVSFYIYLLVVLASSVVGMLNYIRSLAQRRSRTG